jgi:hypothetical protein
MRHKDGDLKNFTKIAQTHPLIQAIQEDEVKLVHTLYKEMIGTFFSPPSGLEKFTQLHTQPCV